MANGFPRPSPTVNVSPPAVVTLKFPEWMHEASARRKSRATVRSSSGACPLAPAPLVLMMLLIVRIPLF
jgi:hypothetical protein